MSATAAIGKPPDSCAAARVRVMGRDVRCCLKSPARLRPRCGVSRIILTAECNLQCNLCLVRRPVSCAKEAKNAAQIELQRCSIAPVL